jgi:hypothetical protein
MTTFWIILLALVALVSIITYYISGIDISPKVRQMPGPYCVVNDEGHLKVVSATVAYDDQFDLTILFEGTCNECVKQKTALTREIAAAEHAVDGLPDDYYTRFG